MPDGQRKALKEFNTKVPTPSLSIYCNGQFCVYGHWYKYLSMCLQLSALCTVQQAPRRVGSFNKTLDLKGVLLNYFMVENVYSSISKGRPMNKLELTYQCDMYQRTGCQEGCQAELQGLCNTAPTSVQSIKSSNKIGSAFGGEVHC